VSTADLAIAAIAAVSLAHGCWDYRIRMRMADRTRVVSPPKSQQQDKGTQDKDKPVDLTQRRTG
jgi:hypothetical protein